MSFESIEYDNEGMEALIFTAEGDMRYALNNLQATHSGFGVVTKENVFKVCDQPHPDLIMRVIDYCLASEFEKACDEIDIIYYEGYNMMDIVGNLTKLVQNKEMDDTKRLVFLKILAEFKMKILEGMDSHL
jgi:replication factor C subunit 2/4